MKISQKGEWGLIKFARERTWDMGPLSRCLQGTHTQAGYLTHITPGDTSYFFPQFADGKTVHKFNNLKMAQSMALENKEEMGVELWFLLITSSCPEGKEKTPEKDVWGLRDTAHGLSSS